VTDARWRPKLFPERGDGPAQRRQLLYCLVALAQQRAAFLDGGFDLGELKEAIVETSALGFESQRICAEIRECVVRTLVYISRPGSGSSPRP
jgi:hypothetical protein